MALRISSLMIIVSSIKLSRESLVLPRPPSSQNRIDDSRNIDLMNGKIYGDNNFYDNKFPTIYYNDNRNYEREDGNGNGNGNWNGGSGSSTNVEKPNTDGYKLLEIELSSKAEERGSNFNFDDILRELFKNEAASAAAGEEEKVKEKKKEEKIKLNDITMRNENNKKSVDYPEKFYYLKSNKNRRTIPRLIKSKDKIKSRDTLTMRITNDEPIKSINEILIKESKNAGTRDSNGEKEIHIIGLINDYYNAANYPGDNYATAEFHTTENSLPTSSELPKQIPPPPSRVPSLTIFSHTTPVLKFMSRRTDILPSY